MYLLTQQKVVWTNLLTVQSDCCTASGAIVKPPSGVFSSILVKDSSRVQNNPSVVFHESRLIGELSSFDKAATTGAATLGPALLTACLLFPAFVTAKHL